MATRGSSGPSKGKQTVQSAARDTESIASDEDLTIELKAQIMALQEAQVKQAVAAAMAQSKMESMEASMQQILDLIKNNTSQSAATLSPPTSFKNRAADSPLPSVEPVHSRFSPTPASQPSEYHHYKPKKGDVVRFRDRDGDIEYRAWKELIYDKFEKDQPLFTTLRDHMSYVFERTEGEAQKHLYPRYTRGPNNLDPFKTYEEMLAFLDTIYLNTNQVQDSRYAYRELRMLDDQSFQDFKTEFIQLANDGEIPMADRFDDLYNKVTIPLQSQLLNQRPALNKDFNKLCEYATEFYTQIKRLNARRNKERDARATKAPALATRPRQTFVPKVAIASPATTAAKPSTGFSMLQRPAPTFPGNTEHQPLLCFNCRRPGHISTACPEPPRASIKDLEEDETAELVDMIDDKQGKEDA
jgi:Zinc knuckle